jgi:hypothetical protein
MKTAAEKLKEIGRVLAQAFKVNDPEQPAPVETPAAEPEAKPEEFADAVAPPAQGAAPAEQPAQPSAEERLANLEKAVQQLQAQLASVTGAQAPQAQAMADVENRLAAVEKAGEMRAQAFRLQHQALENMLEVMEEFSAEPVAQPTEDADQPNFKKRDGSTRAERVAKLLEKMNVKPAAAPAEA